MNHAGENMKDNYLKTAIKKRLFLIPFLITFLLVLSACSNAPKPSEVSFLDEVSELRKGDYSFLKEFMTLYINKQMKEQDTVGLSIAVIDDQEIIWQQGFGYADRSNRIKATPQTRYRAGSISKLFTSMAIMKLAEQGKIDIDQPFVDVLPDFKINSRFGSTNEITPRSIMTHHSGLPSDRLEGTFVAQPKRFTELVHKIKDEYVGYAPNTTFSYSNLGMTLLGHSVENVSAQRYEEYIDKILLKPLSMSQSTFEEGISAGSFSKSYDKNKEVSEIPLRGIPASGLNSTVTDLSRFAMMIHGQGKLDNKEILSSTILNSMMTVQHADLPLNFGNNIGLAWFALKALGDQERVWGHTGATIAHRASFLTAPESKLSVVVLANSASAQAYKISEKLLQIAWQTKTWRNLPKTKEDNLASFDKAKSIEGTYATLLGIVKITKKSDKLYRVSTPRGDFDATPVKNSSEIRLKFRLFGFAPIGPKAFEDTKLHVVNYKGRDLIIGKSKNNKNDLSGEAPFIIKSFDLKIEEGHLVGNTTLKQGDPFSFVFSIVNDEELIIEGLGRSFQETVRVINSGTDNEQFSFHGIRFKRKN